MQGGSLFEGALFTESGKVHRHLSRGSFEQDAREAKRAEDELCWCGNRNPAKLQARWPKLWAVMTEIGKVIEKARAADTELQSLTRTFGDSPDRQPPTAQKIGKLRAKVAEHLGMAPAQAEASHPSSPWKFAVVRKVQSLIGDPDHHVADWLEEGAPLGVRVPIPAGSGAYPLLASPAESTPEEA